MTHSQTPPPSLRVRPPSPRSYCLFWALLLSFKCVFSYSLQIQPLYAPTGEAPRGPRAKGSHARKPICKFGRQRQRRPLMADFPRASRVPPTALSLPPFPPARPPTRATSSRPFPPSQPSPPHPAAHSRPLGALRPQRPWPARGGCAHCDQVDPHPPHLPPRRAGALPRFRRFRAERPAASPRVPSPSLAAAADWSRSWFEGLRVG